MIASIGNIICVDVSPNLGIWEQVLSKYEIEQLPKNCHYFDITNLERLLKVFNKYNPTNVIHLAGKQTPACKANPIQGATVNVIGTVTVFEAVKRYNKKTNKNISIVYASSAGVCGPKTDYLPNTFVQ